MPSAGDHRQAPQAALRAPSESADPVLMPLDAHADVGAVRDWYTAAVEALTDRPPEWCERWIELHGQQLRTVDQVRPGCSAQLSHWAVIQHDKDAD